MASTGQKLLVGIRTDIGRDICKGFGEDARFLDAWQFTLERNGADNWVINPNPDTANETLLNGNLITERSPLRTGDIIAVGRAAKGIVKLPMKVQLL